MKLGYNELGYDKLGELGYDELGYDEHSAIINWFLRLIGQFNSQINLVITNFDYITNKNDLS